MLDENRNMGENKVTWFGDDDAGRSVSSGVYFYKIQTDTHSVVSKILLLK